MNLINNFLRLLVAFTGLSSLYGAWQHWIEIDRIATERGFATINLIGQANFRADVGGIFLIIGIFMLLSAWLRSAIWAGAALIAISSALAGRIISLMIDGSDERIWQPIIVEAIVAAIMLCATLVWRSKRPEGL